jgi:hypothetical protein
VRVERGQAFGVGGCGAKADVSVGVHEDRAGGGQAGGPGVAGRTDDVEESVPAAGQARGDGVVFCAEEQDMSAVQFSVARPRPRSTSASFQAMSWAS